jgi:ABC-type tungstate transport system permease subunit
LKEYTLTDRGTFLSLPANVASGMAMYKVGSDSEDDPLLLPGHLLVGNKARNSTLAKKFAEWAISARGQSVVTGFKKGGVQLYSGAP